LVIAVITGLADILIVEDITGFTPNIITTISCVSIQIRKAKSYIIDFAYITPQYLLLKKYHIFSGAN
jgi:hypothetical protein